MDWKNGGLAISKELLYRKTYARLVPKTPFAGHGTAPVKKKNSRYFSREVRVGEEISCQK
jgi:hypothetical protein